MSYRGSFSALHASYLSVFCFFLLFFAFLLFKASMSCVKAYCVFGCFTLLPPSNFSHQPSCGLRLTGFNHAWLSHTLNHAVASLIVCYYPSCISIRDALPPSPPPLFTGEASRHESDAVLPLCGATQWGKRGGPSQVCLLSLRCKLTQKKTLFGSVGCLPGFLSAPTLPLSSEQWPEEFNKGGEARGQARSGWCVPLQAVGQHGPLVPQTPPALCAS